MAPVRKLIIALAVFSSLSPAAANAALITSLGGQGVYDSDRNITWLANANLAATETFGVSGIYSRTLGASGITISGFMSWDTAQSWIAAMNNANYLGFSDWRLPTVTDTGTQGCEQMAYGGTDCGYNVDTATGELAHLYYDELGNKAFYDTSGAYQPGFGLVNKGPFINFQNSYYWSGTEVAPNANAAWYFYTNAGYQNVSYKNDSMFALAVRPGGFVADVSEPETYTMLLAGLGLLGFTTRRKK